MMVINKFHSDHEEAIRYKSSHGLSVVQQHPPCEPSIDKLSCNRRLNNGIHLSCVYHVCSTRDYLHCILATMTN